MSVYFVDNSVKVKDAMSDVIDAWLYESAGELQAQVMMNTRVDTGQTKGSWQYSVDESAHEAKVGSALQNAIWEEFGTGMYAVHGDGRKTPWIYQDRKGKFHKTVGKSPTRALERAFTSLKPKILSALEAKLKGA